MLILFELIIKLIHFITLLFILFVPLANDNAMLFLYAITIPNLILHWVFKSNVCSLTLIEKFVCNKMIKNYNDDYCVSCKIIDPIYEIPIKYENNMTLIYIIVISLWIYVIYKLYKKYKSGELNSIWELFQSNLF